MTTTTEDTSMTKPEYPPADLDRDEPECCAVHSGYYCTRPLAHEGPHVAHAGIHSREVARWPRITTKTLGI